MKDMQIDIIITFSHCIQMFPAGVMSTIFSCGFIDVQRAVRPQTQSLMSLCIIILHPFYK